MNDRNLVWWRRQSEQMRNLKKPSDLAGLGPSDRDYVDAVVIGGVRFKDIVEGRVAEHQVPPTVTRAYREQYPHLPSLSAEVHRLHGNAHRLRGLAEGIKGKMFEDQYMDWLNHGHLPAGAKAALAVSPTNPAWDIRVTDAHGHILQDLQLKATDNLHLIEHALQRYPDVDVVTTREAFEQVERHKDLVQHVVGTAISDRVLDHTAHNAVDSLSQHDPFALHVPVLSLALIAAMELRRYRAGRQDLAAMLHNLRDRSFLTCLAVGAAWVATGMSGDPIVGLPTGVLVRFCTGSMQRELRFRGRVKGSLSRLDGACRALAELYPPRPAPSPGRIA
jgi:hypothetical protein